MDPLTLCPLTRDKANEYVEKYHRHHKKVVGHLFALGLLKDGELCGVVIVGRPVARALNDGYTCEVTRLCTDGTPNACSILYGAAWRAARALQYRRMYTYILESEPGTSVKAAGFRFDGMTKGGSWSTPSRPRTDKAPTCKKQRWAKSC